MYIIDIIIITEESQHIPSQHGCMTILREFFKFVNVVGHANAQPASQVSHLHCRPWWLVELLSLFCPLSYSEFVFIDTGDYSFLTAVADIPFQLLSSLSLGQRSRIALMPLNGKGSFPLKITVHFDPELHAALIRHRPSQSAYMEVASQSFCLWLRLFFLTQAHTHTPLWSRWILRRRW